MTQFTATINHRKFSTSVYNSLYEQSWVYMYGSLAALQVSGISVHLTLSRFSSAQYDSLGTPSLASIRDHVSRNRNASGSHSPVNILLY